MEQIAHNNKATTPSQDLRSRCQYLHMILSICSYIRTIDWQDPKTVFSTCFGIGFIINWRLAVMAVLMFLMLNLLTSTLDSSKADVTPTAQSGKYIPEEVTTPADAPKGPAPTLPPSSSQTPTRSFNPDEGKVRFGRKPKAAMVVHEKRPDLERLGPLHEDQCTPAANVHHVEKTVKEQKSEVAEKETVVQVEPDTIEGPSEREFSLENDDALQIDPETIEAPIDGRISTGTEDNGSLPPVPQTNNIYTADSTSVEVQYEGDDEASRSENDAVPDLTLESATPPITGIRATAQKSKARRRLKPNAFMHRSQCLKKRHAKKLRVHQLKRINEKKIQDRIYQQAVADCIIEAQGGMIGVEMEDQTGEHAQAGQSTVAAISQPAMVDSAVAAEDKMDGVEVQVPVVDGARDVEMTDAPPEDVIDELMIGSDIDGEMEVDSDEEGVVNDGEPMDVSEDGQNLEATKASRSNPVANAGHSDPVTDAGLSSSMDIEPQNAAGRVNKERLQDKIRREKEELALRTSAQWSQQSAAPATMSITGNAAISIPAKIPQSMPSTNSASELKKAQLGKRAEARVVPAPVASPAVSTPSQAISAPASIASSPVAAKNKEAGANKEDGYKSDTTQSTTTPSTNTPTSTLLSSTSTTAPSSPLPAKASPASKDTPEMAVKRKQPANGTKAGNADTQQDKPPPAPRQAENSPAESSKKVRSKSPPPKKTDAAPEDEVAPLSSIPDDRGLIQHTSDLMQVAEDMWKLSGLGDSSDDEDGHGP